MEKLSPCHAEVWENYSKKSIENQSLNKFDKKHNTLIFHQEKRFREFCQQASTWNTYFEPSKLKSSQSIAPCLLSELLVDEYATEAWNQLMYSEENRFQKHATENISRIEVVSKNNWRKKDPINRFKKISWNSWC